MGAWSAPSWKRAGWGFAISNLDGEILSRGGLVHGADPHGTELPDPDQEVGGRAHRDAQAAPTCITIYYDYDHYFDDGYSCYHGAKLQLLLRRLTQHKYVAEWHV